MDQVGEFLKHASECLAMAAKAKSPQIKSQLKALASSWQQLAAEREKFLKASGQIQKH